MSSFKSALNNELSGVKLSDEQKERLLSAAISRKRRHSAYGWLAAAAALALVLGASAILLGRGDGGVDRTSVLSQPSGAPQYTANATVSPEEAATPQPTATPGGTVIIETGENAPSPMPTPASEELTTPKPTPASEILTEPLPTPTPAPKAVHSSTIYSSMSLSMLSDGISFEITVYAQYLDGELYIYYETDGELCVPTDASGLSNEFIEGYSGIYADRLENEGDCVKAIILTVELRQAPGEEGARAAAFSGVPVMITPRTRYIKLENGELWYADAETERQSFVTEAGEALGTNIPYFLITLQPEAEPDSAAYTSEHGVSLEVSIGNKLTLVRGAENWEDAMEIAIYSNEDRYLFLTEDILQGDAVVIGNTPYSR